VDAYEKVFDPSTSGSLADALAAARPRSASQELDAIVSSHQSPALNSPARIDVAGLALLAGNDDKAREVMQAVDAGSVAPELLARLGWWYFSAGRAAESESVLRKAQTLRPGDADIQNNLAWACFEEGKVPPSGSSYAHEPILQNGADARAVLETWQHGRKADALRQWATVTHQEPQWANPAWRRAIYPPHTNATVDQIEGSTATPRRLSLSPARASLPRPTAGR
jgi:predicted Zn-dependent protease